MTVDHDENDERSNNFHLHIAHTQAQSSITKRGIAIGQFFFLLSFFLPSATFYFAHAYFRLDAAAMKVYTFRCNFPFINGRTMIRWSS